MNRRTFLEKFAKASGVTIATGISVSCTAIPGPGPTEEYPPLFDHIDYLDLDGRYRALVPDPLLACYNSDLTRDVDRVVCGIPATTSRLQLVFSGEVALKEHAKIHEHLAIEYTSDEGYTPIDYTIVAIDHDTITIAFKKRFDYHTTFVISGDPILLGEDKSVMLRKVRYFDITALKLSEERLSLDQGAEREVSVVALYEQDQIKSFEEIILVPEEKKPSIVSYRRTEEGIVIEATTHGKMRYSVEAIAQVGEEKVCFKCELYVVVN